MGGLRGEWVDKVILPTNDRNFGFLSILQSVKKKSKSKNVSIRSQKKVILPTNDRNFGFLSILTNKS